ncbi:hypothetical protein A3A93_01805 [Candidatus Roizmanbacteria bacterium RIFCSPLOWO2_01_FULL_38_12]|uniref:ChsH2 C-terminal OB-fold domain-containing protein n=1 Tax=Candidatus Roizmanbacteria bacterium RIFCSPLOWO2_01_FULL_38_12 TaxID=1802061 RepID=A0A1F7IYC6_9BACT|nr:MAG: hypothetical protein A2861_02190 [Candidatus Roizmanbacteria bacterium RIFCSPHIGHO2_01_FULL_38_15]OGK34522.1 MAG: hypothetical protein A3F59_04335 [Candidatus Roizmanbacteria bacterium RIFCSPHIGHO2_12_FULL_38_13]OGK48351.1 MAG: hypothetical protein A3A93_01805 [Candidatus Roizmanbacteria bacterium RIFCSPLOWO2_01_FULL_38_12]
MKSVVAQWRKQKKDVFLLGKKGKIITWTKIMVSPPKFQAFTPYLVVLVELENKERVYGQLVDLDDKDPKINQNVIAVLRKTASVGSNDLIEYGVKFMPF